MSISNDKSIKVFDVANIDMMVMLRLPYVPACAEWVYRVRCFTYVLSIVAGVIVTLRKQHVATLLLVTVPTDGACNYQSMPQHRSRLPSCRLPQLGSARQKG